MNRRRLLVLRGTAGEPPQPPDTDVLEFGELRRRILSREWGGLFLGHREARMLTSRLGALPKPLNSAVLLRLLARGRCVVADEEGNREPVTAAYLAGLAAGAGRDLLGAPFLLRRHRLMVAALAARRAGRLARRRRVDGRPLYLRTDLIYGLRSGGSVGHIAGVLNNLGHFTPPPLFVTTDRIPTVSPDVETLLLPPPRRYRDFAELPAVYHNEVVPDLAREALGRHPAGFVYQRYSLNSWAGVALAEGLGVPLALEYNGSELWISRNWGKPLKHEDFSRRVEELALGTADLVVVVSRAMRDELLGRGIDGGRILVNPNGVDTDRYHPAVDGSGVRRRYGLEGKTVLGFIGTFGRWHGAEVLAEAFGRLLADRPELRDNLRLLMVGDGQTMPEVRERLDRWNVAGETVLTGLVSQEEGPAHLAACDVLVASHVGNPDGTPFFGSPTKLFEYMAMGRGIVASNLDQIGELLAHGRTAWLVPPGDAVALAAGLDRLAADPALRAALGEAARVEAVAKHTWREHTRLIVERLEEKVS